MARRTLRVGIVGVGNCASSFVQGIRYYGELREDASQASGLMHSDIGGYRPGDIEIAAAFDIHAGKVGKNVAEAIFVPPNNTLRFSMPPETSAVVMRGPTLDGRGKYTAEDIE